MIAALLAAGIGCAFAQLPWGHPGTSAVGLCGGSYVGPGDLVPGAKVWVGLRAYSNTNCGALAIKVERLSDNATLDIRTLINSGNLDSGSVSSFSGTDATCTGTIAGTTLSVSSCTGTPHVLDEISGSGITGPAYITSIGTCASPPGTCTLNASQTVGSPETITARVATRVAKLYDQSGALYCTSTACDYSEAGTSRPYLFLNCINSRPCIFTQVAQPGDPTTANSGTWNQPLSVSSVAIRPTFNGDYGFLWGGAGAGGCSGCAFGFFNSANKVGIFWSAVPSVTAADGAWHAFQFVLNSASSVINVDNTATSVNGGSANLGSVPLIYAQNTFSHILPGYSTELGTWTLALSSGNQTALCHNQFAYWGTSTSC